jgi:hypothetical protein
MTRRRRFNHVTMALGDAAKTIPAGGLVPLPDKALFGMKTIDDMIILGGGLGYVIEYVPATHKLIWYMADYDAVADGALIVAAGEAPAATALRAIVLGK